ncbi:MAG: hypothetical protein GTO29_13290 [Candidatus Latescibacteria bacterium]|nr:hypothetical protein [Candidatus Latescibacterota bacterium]NIO57225.1 hypothetical protein [Candidatus Latescibacterota bacterium]
MPKAFSVASWNVEHFGNDPSKISSTIKYLADQKADIVAIYEVASSKVFRPIVKAMPKYQFHITEGPQTQEILIGIRYGVSAYVTQKLEFKSGQPSLRPGVLVTVNKEGKYYSLLFLHLKSLSDPKGFGLRDDMINRALKFRKTLDKVAGGTGKANYIFLGDLNTMGQEYPYVENIDAEAEIRRLGSRASRRKMRILTKNSSHTWWNGPSSSYEPGNLDHVVAAKHLKFKPFQGAEVDVRGWPKEATDTKKGHWISKYSDHALIYFEVQQL